VHLGCSDSFHDNFTGSVPATRYYRWMRSATGALVLCCVFAGHARADQCEWLDDKQVAIRAAQELERAKRFVTLCEPCGDTAPSAVQIVVTATTRAVPSNHLGTFEEVVVNDQTIDLAYTYVDAGDRYVNLAKLVGCPAVSVSPSLTIEGKPAGVVDTPVTLPSPPVCPPPGPLTLDPDSRIRWELSIGDSLGTVGLMRQSLDVEGLTVTGGIRTHALAVFADYRRLSIERDATESAREESPTPSGSVDTVQRLGIGARYNIVAIGARDHAAPLHDVVELFLEGGIGAQRLAWEGGAMWRGDLAIGGGARLLGFRVNDRRTVGVLVRVLDVYSRDDSGVLVSLSLAVTN
jgi:hypothetical protein